MWELISRIILRNRLALLIAVLLATLFMGYMARSAQMSYEYAQILPESDDEYKAYRYFREEFGEDGSVLVIGIEDENLFKLDHFNALFDLGHDLKNIEGVQEVVSIARIFNLHKNTRTRKFEFTRLFSEKPDSQEQLDSLKEIALSLSFYKGLLYTENDHASLLVLTLDKKVIDSPGRIQLVNQIKGITDQFSERFNIEVHYSGLPYIRTVIATRIASEIELFLMLAALVTAFILYLFFRSFSAVFFSMLVVACGVVWSLGTGALLGYKITLLTGLIPPLIIVIGVPNCIFLLNKYHREFRAHGNKIKALSRTIQKIGRAAFLTNATTSIGFIAFTITRSPILKEFGVLAAFNIMVVFFLSMTLIPIIFSYLPEPKKRHTKHLENARIKRIVDKLDWWVHNRRPVIYLITVLVVILSFVGLNNIRTTGYMVDDLPQHDPVLVDLKFFEKHFNGVMPFEIVVDTRQKGGVMKLGTLVKIDELQQLLSTYPEFSKPVSLAELIKFSTQAFFNGKPSWYRLPNEYEIRSIIPYVPKSGGNQDVLRNFIDKKKQLTRITVQMADVGSARMEELKDELSVKINEIFSPDEYDVTITGKSVIFLKGTKYLVDNLILSVLLAIAVISILMSLMFMSFRMVLISLVPNLIPLLLTGGLMGYFGIPLKPSTILVFSIAFGISVDNTIHFLAKYRQDLKITQWNISRTITMALQETGVSMIYTSCVLFFGFFIFTASNFGGTKSLGILISITLLFALFSNLMLLPSFLLSLEKSIRVRAMKEPLIDIYDEEEDIELDELEVRRDEVVTEEQEQT
jgi:uncharacterized protein